MSNRKSGPPATPEDVGVVLGWLKDFFRQFQLAWRLILDPRVSLFAKFIPLLTVVYLLSPWDFVPDVALGLGQLDDLAMLLVGLRLFIDVCPPSVVEEVRALLQDGGEESWSAEDVIDVEVIHPQDEEENA
ncbi:MAG: YkvA family protein [Anaerolineae bacterium]